MRYAIAIGALAVLGLGALLWSRAQPASRAGRNVQPAREPEPGGAARAPSTQAPLRTKAPPTGAALSDTTARLRRAKRLSPEQRQKVLRELTDLLLKRPERASDVVALLRELDGRYLMNWGNDWRSLAPAQLRYYTDFLSHRQNDRVMGRE